MTTSATSTVNIQNACPNATWARSVIFTNATAQPMAKTSAMAQGFKLCAKRKTGAEYAAGGRSNTNGVST